MRACVRVCVCVCVCRYEEAEAYMLQAITICEDLEDEQVSLLRNIAFLYTELRRFTEAKECVSTGSWCTLSAAPAPARAASHPARPRRRPILTCWCTHATPRPTGTCCGP